MGQLKTSYRAQQALNMLDTKQRSALQKQAERYVEKSHSSVQNEKYTSSAGSFIVKTSKFFLFFDAPNHGRKDAVLTDIVAVDHVLVSKPKSMSPKTTASTKKAATTKTKTAASTKKATTTKTKTAASMKKATTIKTKTAASTKKATTAKTTLAGQKSKKITKPKAK